LSVASEVAVELRMVEGVEGLQSQLYGSTFIASREVNAGEVFKEGSSAEFVGRSKSFRFVEGKK
jgi:hypothetical protein